VAWQDNDEVCSTVQFQGAGRTPQEQRANMQQQLAAMCSSADFRAPESWPAHGCLASFTSDGLLGHHNGDVFLRAAAHTPSLSSLDVSMDDASLCTSLRSLSCLQRLTHMTLSCPTDPGTLDHQALSAIGQLSRLQQLHMHLDLFEQAGSDEGVSIPESWSGLSSLTRVWFRVCDEQPWPQLAAAQLSRLAVVEDLVLTEVVVAGGVSSLFALTRLTSLAGPSEFTASDGEDGGGEALGSRGVEVPQQWRDGLQNLSWEEDSSSSLAMLSQLTSLTSLSLGDACISSQLCR
jgi:hypothetical protein